MHHCYYGLSIERSKQVTLSYLCIVLGKLQPQVSPWCNVLSRPLLSNNECRLHCPFDRALSSLVDLFSHASTVGDNAAWNGSVVWQYVVSYCLAARGAVILADCPGTFFGVICQDTLVAYNKVSLLLKIEMIWGRSQLCFVFLVSNTILINSLRSYGRWFLNLHSRLKQMQQLRGFACGDCKGVTWNGTCSGSDA